MDPNRVRHEAVVNVPFAPGFDPPVAGAGQSAPGEPERVDDFDAIYEQDFDFAWRSLRRLGVPSMLLEDAVQDLFIVVARRLHEFDGRSRIRTWIFAIAIRIAKEYRRRMARQQLDAESAKPSAPALPSEQCMQKESVRLLDALLGLLDEDKRIVFILAELEEMSVPEIATVVGANPNTVYSRLRAARLALNAAILRYQSDTKSKSAGSKP
jgi:RNA polymerase sigma-70 factor, ECF subfamily